MYILCTHFAEAYLGLPFSNSTAEFCTASDNRKSSKIEKGGKGFQKTSRMHR